MKQRPGDDDDDMGDVSSSIRNSGKQVWNATKSMFVHGDGTVKWSSMIGIGAGAVAGVFVLPALVPALAGAGLVSGLLGAGAGLMTSQLYNMVVPDAPARLAPTPAGEQPQRSGSGQSPHHDGPGAIPAKPPAAREPGVRQGR